MTLTNIDRRHQHPKSIVREIHDAASVASPEAQQYIDEELYTILIQNANSVLRWTEKVAADSLKGVA